MLARHWHVWQSFGAKAWTVRVLQHGSLVPFHHLPPLSQDSWEVPSCTLGSVRALSLKEEVSKLLQKGALECVDQPSPSFYSCLFLVEKAGHQFIHPQWLCHPDQVLDGDGSVGFVVILEGRLDILHQPQRHLLPDLHPSGLSPVSLVCSRQLGVPVSSPVL